MRTFYTWNRQPITSTPMSWLPNFWLGLNLRLQCVVCAEDGGWRKRSPVANIAAIGIAEALHSSRRLPATPFRRQPAGPHTRLPPRASAAERGMTFIDDPCVSSTSSGTWSRTLEFTAGKVVLIQAPVEPIPAGRPRGPSLTLR